MRKLSTVAVALLVSGILYAQTIEIIDTLATRILPVAGIGICKSEDYIYAAQGTYGIMIYRVTETHIVEDERFSFGSDLGDNVIDVAIYKNSSGREMLAALFNCPSKLLQFFYVNTPTDLQPVTMIESPESYIVGHSVSYDHGWILACSKENTGDKGGFYLMDGHSPVSTAIVDEWWPADNVIVTDAVVLTPGDPGWIVASILDNSASANRLQVFEFYNDYAEMTPLPASYALPATSKPGEIATGWFNSSTELNFYVALGPDGVGAYKILFETGEITPTGTWTSPNVSDIRSIARWGNRLYCADYCTTHSADAYALHIIALDTLTMGFDGTVTPVSLHGRLGRDVCADSSKVWIIADVPRGSDTSPGAR